MIQIPIESQNDNNEFTVLANNSLESTTITLNVCS